MVSPLANAVQFLIDFGFFDVVLPFLLTFTIVYAILDKIKIFGYEDEGKKIPKKNVNAMVAFVTALFVVATTSIVTAIQVSLPQVFLILIIIVSFMILLGSFRKDEEFHLTESGWGKFLGILIFVGIIIVFLNAFDWLGPIIKYIVENVTGTFIVSIIFLIIIIMVIYFVVRGPQKGKKEG